MSYIFGKLWHLAIIWAIRKAFQCILQGDRFLLANHTRLSPTSENESYIYYIWYANFVHFTFHHTTLNSRFWHPKMKKGLVLARPLLGVKLFFSVSVQRGTTRVAEVGNHSASAKMTTKVFVRRIFVLCNRPLFVQETLFLTQKSTFFAHSLQKNA